MIPTKSHKLTPSKFMKFMKDTQEGAYSLVGVNLATNLISGSILTSAFAEGIEYDKATNIITTSIDIKPIPNNDGVSDDAFILQSQLEYTGMGESNSVFTAPTGASNFLSDLVLPNSSFSNIQTYSFSFNFLGEATEYGKISLNGKVYYEIRLRNEYTPPIGMSALTKADVSPLGKPYWVDLILLLKVKEYDAETFLGGLVGDHNKRDTKILLDSFVYPASTDYMILDYQVKPLNYMKYTPCLFVNLAPSASVTNVLSDDTSFILECSSGYVQIPYSILVKSTISKLTDAAYVFTIFTKQGVISLTLSK